MWLVALLTGGGVAGVFVTYPSTERIERLTAME